MLTTSKLALILRDNNDLIRIYIIFYEKGVLFMDNVGEIQSKMDNLNEVILNNNRSFHIPDFQRDFVWTSEEAEELFQDLSEDTNNFQTETSMLQGYLLGNIVLINSQNTWLVVDGQQRLTTLTLIFKALYEIVKKKALDENNSEREFWYTKRADLDKGFNRLDDAGEIVGLRITHEPTLPFGTYYKKLIQDYDNLQPSTVSDENIEDVYNSLYDNLQSLSDNQLIRFIVYLRTKVKLIVTIAPSQAKAFQLFEVLNDRGQSLEPLDLVKNLFLKKLSELPGKDEKIRDFNKNWTSFLTNLKLSPKRKISSSTFMKHFVAANFSENIKQNNLFDFFDQTGRIKSEEILPLSEKLVFTSKIYQDIEKNPKENDFSKHQNMFILFRLLRVKQFHPILMNFYEAPQEIKNNVLDACVRYAAAIIFSYTQTNTIEKEIPSLIRSISLQTLTFEEKERIIVNKINELANKQVGLLKNIIPSKSFANAQGNVQKKASDLIKFIELYFNSNTSIISIPRGKKISIEHIMPQTTSVSYSHLGFNSPDEYKEYLNHIGNLTLLFADENTSAGNKSFTEKVDTYSKTSFIVTKSIVKNIETSIKKGKTTIKTDLINEYQPKYIREDMSNIVWGKEYIDIRGNQIATLLADLITEKILTD